MLRKFIKQNFGPLLGCINKEQITNVSAYLLDKRAKRNVSPYLKMFACEFDRDGPQPNALINFSENSHTISWQSLAKSHN